MSNECHNPAGDPTGGQFCSDPQGGGGGGNPSEPTVEEELGIKAYTDHDYHKINMWLREYGPGNAEDLHSTIEHTIARLDSYFNHVQLDKDTTVWRGMSDYALKKLGPLATGTVYQDKGFVSTSRDHQWAASNALYQSGSDAASVLWEIRLPKGSRAADVSRYSNVRKEQEVLISRNSKFKIVGVTQTPKGTRIKAEYAP